MPDALGFKFQVSGFKFRVSGFGFKAEGICGHGRDRDDSAQQSPLESYTYCTSLFDQL
jgi:hypothetical protein